MRIPVFLRNVRRSSNEFRRWMRTSSTVFEGIGGVRNDGRHPSDPFLQVVEDRSAPTDRGARARGLDRHLARFGLEEELADLRLDRDELANRLLGLLGVDQRGGVRTNHHPPVEPLGDLAEVVAPGEERVELLRVDHDVRAFQLNVGDLDGLRQHFVQRFPGLLDERFETHSLTERVREEGVPRAARARPILTEERGAAVS